MTWNMIKFDCNFDLWKDKIKGSLDLKNQGLLWKKVLVIFGY